MGLDTQIIPGSIKAENDVIGQKLIVLEALYFGGNQAEGSLRLRVSGTDLLIERLESNVWTEKARITA